MHPGYEVMDGSNPVRGQAKGSKKQKDFWLIRLGERLSGGGN